MKKTRILVVGPTPPPHHGGTTGTRNLLTSRLRDEFELVHLDTADRRGLGNLGRLDLVNVVLALWHGLRFMVLLAAARPDIVYVPIAQNRLAFLRDCLFLVPSRLLGKRIVLHIRGGHFGTFRQTTDPCTRALLRWVFRGAERVIVLGDCLRWMVRGLVPDEHIAVVPNGVDEDIEPATGPRSGRERRVVFLATLTKTKGFVDFLEAARRIAPERDDVRFIVAGGFARPSDRRAAAEYRTNGLEDRIEFAGTVAGERKARLLADADIFVFPTFFQYEGHPHVVLEAMAAGLPVISTARGAIPETVHDGENGFIVPEHDPGAVADRIRRLLDDEELRTRLGRDARRTYLDRYTVERWAERMAGVFRSVGPNPAASAPERRVAR